MEPTPPKTSRISKKFHRPFYEAKRKTSAEIVSEARSSLRTLETKRPFTPAEPNRTLFSGTSEKQDGRPSSACSVALSYTDSRPPTGKKLLSPIEDFSDIKESEKNNKRGSAKSKLDGDTNGRNNVLYEELEANQHSPHLEKFQVTTESQGVRVNSGPVNRTPPNWTTLKQRSNSFGDITVSNKAESHRVNKENNKKAYFNDNIKPLLRQMELNHLHQDDDSLLVNFDILWKTLEIGNMIGKSQLGSKRRSQVLSSVYKCTSGDNVKLLLKLSRLFLTLEVTGKNLEAVCKLMLKVSRNKKHDELFVEEMLVGLLLNLLKFPQHLDMTNCLVYLTGIIKFLSLNSIVLNEMVKYDALQSISSLLLFTINEFSGNDTQNEESCHMLVQITSALVNFANVVSLKKKFISYGILQQILDLTETRYKDSDYFMNIARLLSKLTMDENICHEISKIKSNYKILFGGLKFNYRKANISVRICYMFGNIAHYCHDSREHLAYEYNGIELLVEIANYYLKLLEEEQTPTKDIEDVLVKIMRIIANLSMDEKCGISFSDYQGCIDILYHIIDLMDKKRLSDELQISCATTLNNLSYFAASDSILIKNEESITLGMIDMLLSENVTCVLEAMRVLGNFTKSKVVRDILMNNEVFDVIMNLLESNHPAIIFCTCGVLVNIMVDNNNRSQLKDFGGITRLINILKECAESDWSLAGLICQILWNYSEKIVTATDTFGISETDDLITLLNELLEPELALDYESRGDLDDNVIEVLKDTWNMQFKPVASLLIKRIDMHHSDLIPILSAPD